MTQGAVTTKVRRAGDRTAIIDIVGEVTGGSEASLTDSYNEASTDVTRAVVLNFTGLEYMNSSGIGLLVTLLVRANRQKQRLLAYGLNEHYREIFAVTRLDEAIGIFGTEDEALAAAEGA